MKKFFFLLGTFLLLICAACGSSIDSKISEVETLAKEAKQIQQEMINGNYSNQEKLNEIVVKMGQIGNELSKEQLSPEQKKRLTQAALGI